MPAQGNGGRNPHVVVIGGGTGTYAVLSSLRDYPVRLSAIVAMSDDGGSSGLLRDEFGVLPPGDLRQCLVALSDAPGTMRELFMHRFDRGALRGHSFGNLFISTLQQITGSIDHAIELAGKFLRIRGQVIPVTLDDVTLVAKLKNGKTLRGEGAISDYQLVSRFGIADIRLSPSAKANPRAVRTIMEADTVIVGPGSVYSSLIPNFLVEGIADALRKSKAKKIYIVNLMNKHGHTDRFTVADYLSTIERTIGKPVFDTVLYNTARPKKALLREYADEGEPVRYATDRRLKHRTVIGKNIIAERALSEKKGDLLYRTLIRHDPAKLGRTLLELIRKTRTA